jgi:hypothetical protein
MPGAPTELGFVYFVGVKLAGYTLFAWKLRLVFVRPGKSAFLVGVTRTAIGVVAGAAFAGLWGLYRADDNTLYWFATLLPVRVLEWGLFIRLFFEPTWFASGRTWTMIAFGTVVSYTLDLIGVASAFVLPGGFWVC